MALLIFYILDTFIQKTKKTYTDSRSRRNFGQLNNELQDVQRIMVQNIDDVLTRGEALSGTVITQCWHIVAEITFFASRPLFITRRSAIVDCTARRM